MAGNGIENTRISRRRVAGLTKTVSRGPADNQSVSDEELVISLSSKTSDILNQCRRTMLSFYLFLLKAVGWRHLCASHHDLGQPLHIRVLNVVYPIAFLVIFSACSVIQGITCYSRSQGSSTFMNNTITCSSSYNILFGNVGPDILNITAYLWGIYVFRIMDPDYLNTLMETVFLSCSESSQTSLKKTLQCFLALGVAWIVFTLSINVLRIFSLQLLDSNVTIETISGTDSISSPGPLRYLMVILSLFGYLIVDLVYISVLINYVSQCELVIVYIRNITQGARNKTLSLEEAHKTIFRVHEFLNTLNGHFGNMQSIILIICGGGLFFSTYYLIYRENDASLSAVVAVMNVIQWLTITAFPVIEAARLTSHYSKMKGLGLEIASRPYIYSDAPQDSLDGFLLFTSSTHYAAELFCFPFHIKYVIIFVVALGFAGSVIRFPISWI